jgi:quercetin dioxygenase-like cupin family protein
MPDMKTENLNQNFGTLSQTINGLIKLGYTHDFNIQDECIVCQRANITLSPEEFKIDHVYRFEGDSDPDYQSILYAISSDKYGVKGTLVNAYGIYSDDASSRLIEKLETHGSPQAIQDRSLDATQRRPEGERTINSSLLKIDLNEFIRQIKSEPAWVQNDRNSVTVFKSDAMRIVLLGLRANAELKPHKAAGMISVQVLEGRIEFAIDGQSEVLMQGQMVALHEGIMHSVKAMEDSFFLLTMALKN